MFRALAVLFLLLGLITLAVDLYSSLYGRHNPPRGAGRMVGLDPSRQPADSAAGRGAPHQPGALGSWYPDRARVAGSGGFRRAGGDLLAAAPLETPAAAAGETAIPQLKGPAAAGIAREPARMHKILKVFS
jgi:hypothetical protein